MVYFVSRGVGIRIVFDGLFIIVRVRENYVIIIS